MKDGAAEDRRAAQGRAGVVHRRAAEPRSRRPTTPSSSAAPTRCGSRTSRSATSLPTMVKGPLTVTDLINMHMGGGWFGYGNPPLRLAFENRKKMRGFYTKNEFGAWDVVQRVHWEHRARPQGRRARGVRHRADAVGVAAALLHQLVRRRRLVVPRAGRVPQVQLHGRHDVDHRGRHRHAHRRRPRCRSSTSRSPAPTSAASRTSTAGPRSSSPRASTVRCGCRIRRRRRITSAELDRGLADDPGADRRLLRALRRARGARRRRRPAQLRRARRAHRRGRPGPHGVGHREGRPRRGLGAEHLGVADRRPRRPQGGRGARPDQHPLQGPRGGLRAAAVARPRCCSPSPTSSTPTTSRCCATPSEDLPDLEQIVVLRGPVPEGCISLRRLPRTRRRRSTTRRGRARPRRSPATTCATSSSRRAPPARPRARCSCTRRSARPTSRGPTWSACAPATATSSSTRSSTRSGSTPASSSAS